MTLTEDTSFDQVIPILAVSFGSQGQVEDEVLGNFSGELYDTPVWQLVEEAVESGHLLPAHIHSEFGAFFRDELSEAAWSELRAVDREFLQAAALGDASSLWILGLRLVRAAIAAVDLDEQSDLDEDGLFLIVEAAEAGDARAQWMLGERFSRMQDGLEESVRLLGMASAQGFGQAALRLEELFERRYTFAHGPSEAKWLRRFARAGVVTAQFDLANDLYLKGELKTAFAWMLRAAKAAHIPAQQRLAFYYEVGEGCSRNLQRARYWRNLATCKDDSAASFTPEKKDAQASSATFRAPTQNAESKIEVESDRNFESIAAGVDDGDVQEPPIRIVADEHDCEEDEGKADQESEIPILTTDEALLAPDEMPEQHGAAMLDSSISEESQASEEPRPFDLPSAPVEKKPDFGSRFRSGLAGVLRRLADRVSR